MMADTNKKCPKWGLIIDITRCDGCGSCLLSVKDEYVYNNSPGYAAEQPCDGVNWLWLKEIEQGQGMKVKMDYIPVLFPHDRNFDPQKEIPGCPEGAVYVRPDGLTIIDPEKAKGCKAIYEYFEKAAPAPCSGTRSCNCPRPISWTPTGWTRGKSSRAAWRTARPRRCTGAT